MRARAASGVVLAMGVADLAVLNLLIAPRLQGSPAFLSRNVGGEVTERVSVSLPAPTEMRLRTARPAENEPGPSVPLQAAPLQLAMPAVLFALGDIAVEGFSVRSNLANIAGQARTNPKRRLLVRGHSDRLGTPEHNVTLSRDRAEAVADLLRRSGAAADQIEVEARGDSEPADKSDTPGGWAQNRRVEVFWK